MDSFIGTTTTTSASSLMSTTTGRDKPRTKTIEERYQKKTPIEHILHRPESYIGSVQQDSQTIWVWDEAKGRMVYKPITYVPGLFKIFDEILVNAADVKAREENERRGGAVQKMTNLKVDIDPETGTISIYNDGEGIPIEIHKEHNVYVPELIFGHLLTSDNYDDTEDRVTGGRNGYGAKLTNIFSTLFTIECADSKRKRKFRKVWRNNMSKSDPCKITEYKESKDFVKVTFIPDLHRFQGMSLDEDIMSLFVKRVYDIAGCIAVKVWLNGKRLAIDNFKSYVDLYFPNQDSLLMGAGARPPIKIHEKSGRWEVVISMSEGQFQQVSFVNSICTSKGGTHVNYVTDPLVQAILKKVNSKNKGGMELKGHHVKAHLWVFVNCLIVNPTFDSQTKETLTLKTSQFGSKFSLADKTINAVIKSEILESVLLWAKTKQQVELQKKMKGTQKGGKDHISGIPKLEDANDAGTKHSQNCTLILTEGESAKTSCVAGLSIVGKDRYGVFPLKGKLLNVREASFKQQIENQEIQSILKIMGLQVGKKFETPKDLRYGSLMIMTDQDLDGSHIKGLLINMIAHYWPSLLQYRGFLKEFITPIVKVTKGTQVISFYTLSEYETWKQKTNGKGWKIRYYKGLGTSTDREFKAYFSDLGRHSLDFIYTGTEDLDAIDMAFNGKRAEDRKLWIQNYNTDEFIDHTETQLTYKDFINKELVAFSKYDVIRSIPNCIDGLKPVQRKVLFSAFKRNLKTEIKVAQFIGYVSEKAAYHHGEQSLGSTIIGMAQTFVGSNNMNLLQPCGQFGSRKEGGKDASAVRYIFTRLSPMARALFPEEDDPLLEYQNDDGLLIEPKYYVPIIPLVLVNGSEGIGTGWSSFVPNYNPRDIISNIRKFIKGESMEPMSPWYRHFKGPIERKTNGFDSVGIIETLDHETIQISELPVKLWTQNFKTFLEDLREDRVSTTQTTIEQDNTSEGLPGKGKRGLQVASTSFSIVDYRDNSNHEDILFTVKVTPATMTKLKKEGLEKSFKLRKTLPITNMTLFDPHFKVQRYVTELDIIREFGSLRLQYYELRREYLIEKIEREKRILKNKVKFIEAIIEHRLIINNRKKDNIIEDLVKQDFDTITKIQQASVLMWRLEQERIHIESEISKLDTEIKNEEEMTIDVKSKEFDYLLGMTLWTLTLERVEELRELLKKREEELAELQKKTPEDLWDLDLLNLEKVLEQQDRDDQEAKLENQVFKKQHRRLSEMEWKGNKKSTTKRKVKKIEKNFEDSNSEFMSSNPSDEDANGLPIRKKAPAPKRKPKARIIKLNDQNIENEKQKTENSPKPLKGFTLADRIKSRNNNSVVTNLHVNEKQKTLEEMLGISSASSSNTTSPSNKRVLLSDDDDISASIGPSPPKRLKPTRGRLRKLNKVIDASANKSPSSVESDSDVQVTRQRQKNEVSSEDFSDGVCSDESNDTDF